MNRLIEIFKSAEHRWIAWIALATLGALFVALPTGKINIIQFIFNHMVDINSWEFVFFIPVLILMSNVVCKLNLNPLLIDICFFFSKFLVKSIYCVVGFCATLMLAHLVFGHTNYAAYFAITGLTIYLISIAAHWMIFDLESQSRELCTETYC